MEDKPVLEAHSEEALLHDKCLQYSSILASVIIWWKEKHCWEKGNSNVVERKYLLAQRD